MGEWRLAEQYSVRDSGVGTRGGRSPTGGPTPLSRSHRAATLKTPPPGGKRGRQQQFSDAAVQACLTLKVLFGMPLRQTTGFVQNLLRLVDLDWAVPEYSTLCRRQKTMNVSSPYRGGPGPLNLLIESTGIKSEGEGEWNARKHGGPKRRIWRKIHIGIDAETRLCCTNGVRDSLSESSVVADCDEQLVPYEVQGQELAFVQHGAEAARFAINLI